MFHFVSYSRLFLISLFVSNPCSLMPYSDLFSYQLLPLLHLCFWLGSPRFRKVSSDFSHCKTLTLRKRYHYTTRKLFFDTLAVKVLRVFYLCRSISKPWFFRAVFSSHSLLLALFSPHPLPVVIFFFCVALSYRPCGLILFSYMC